MEKYACSVQKKWKTNENTLAYIPHALNGQNSKTEL